MAKVDKSKDKSFAERYPDDEPIDPIMFSGVARSVQCFLNNGKFKDFRILTLTLDEGVVVDVKYSDPYASFEAISRMELSNEMAIHHLNNNWQDGRTLSK